jgi:hypothetical protein
MVKTCLAFQKAPRKHERGGQKNAGTTFLEINSSLDDSESQKI